MVLEKFLPKKTEKEIISMRIPADVLAKLDAKADALHISRNELINQCILFALANMDETGEEK